MPPTRRAKQGQAQRKSARNVPHPGQGTQPHGEAVAAEPEIIRLGSDPVQPQGNTTNLMTSNDSSAGSSSVNTWKSALGFSMPDISPQILATSQTEFQMPDVRCADDDLAMHVPQDICIKIWKHEYINLAALLKKNQKRRGEESGNLFVNEHGQIQTRPKVLKEIGNIREWTDAFLIFMAIYLKKYREKVFELLQYMNTIREAESRCQNLAWREYDAEFRTRQALKLEPWSKIYSDLWLKLMTNTNRLETIGFQPKAGFIGQSGQSRPMLGICYDFNKGRCYFRNCKFSHICLACKGEHGEHQCSRVVASQNVSQNSPKAQENSQKSSFRGPFKRK